MKLYVVLFEATAFLEPRGFRRRPWALCQDGTGEFIFSYETQREAVDRAVEWNRAN